ncbi:MAG: hypothetical protein M3P39_05075, partial [Actinomycetota bacterium]|nr:hypothetical protein [Actinomycetota bacterium]
MAAAQAPPPDPRLSVGHALALGALHGAAELLPVSSSAHVALLPRLAGWDEAALTGRERKALEVALHAGTAPALLWLLRRDALRALRALDARRLALHVLALAPAVVAGAAFERLIEERLGGPGATAAGLLAGAGALAGAD